MDNCQHKDENMQLVQCFHRHQWNLPLCMEKACAKCQFIRFNVSTARYINSYKDFRYSISILSVSTFYASAKLLNKSTTQLFKTNPHSNHQDKTFEPSHEGKYSSKITMAPSWTCFTNMLRLIVMWIHLAHCGAISLDYLIFMYKY